ncbi:MAG TPA: hypothetical protein VFD58_32805 [Blastocatellia bacterium]|nr:hypothetical protein [Blastocatellia bacterium]
MFAFSRRLAIIFGILLPLGETFRSWGAGRPWWAWFDDYLIGAFLLLGAWRSRSDTREGQRVLAAAWGFACGLGYASFFGHLEHIREPDPGNIPQVTLTIIIGTGWLLAILALIASLKRLPEKE